MMRVDLKKVKNIVIIACNIGMSICLAKETLTNIAKEVNKQENK